MTWKVKILDSESSTGQVAQSADGWKRAQSGVSGNEEDVIASSPPFDCKSINEFDCNR